jgi:hypothetical protein
MKDDLEVKRVDVRTLSDNGLGDHMFALDDVPEK